MLGRISPAEWEELAKDSAVVAAVADAVVRLDAALTSPRWFQTKGSGVAARRAGRLLLARVRHQRDRAAVQRRSRRARRRSSQGLVRSRHPARRRRPAVRRGLLPPEPRRRRLAAGALPPPRAGRDGADQHRHAGRRSTSPATTVTVSDLARRCRSHRAVPARRTRRHRSTVRRRRRAPPAPGDGARHRRGHARCARSISHPQVFHTNEGHAGFLALERIRELVGEWADASTKRSRRHAPAACSPPTHRCRPASTASPAT